MATAASAVGLGNIWKFPYMAGQNGGSAFILIYLVCVILFGVPIMLCEFSIGQNAHSGIHSAFKRLSGSNKWQWIGTLFTLASVLFLSFYLVVTGWCLNYLVQALTNSFEGATTDSLTQAFATTTTETWQPLIYIISSAILSMLIIWWGVQNGIERVCKIMMPTLLILLAILAVQGILMDKDMEGIAFLFHPNFSQINAMTIFNAMGQCFFSLSIGLGVMITYGAYANRRNNPVATSFQVVIIDTLVAILAGLAIFPAVFSLGIAPEQGTELVFVTLPLVFEQIDSTGIMGILFFLLLFIAAITSTISGLEVPVAYTVGKTGMKRRHAILLWTSVAIVLASLCSLSLSNKIGSHLFILEWPLFDWFDFFVSRLLLPIGGIVTCIFVGWVMPRYKTKRLLKHCSKAPNWLLNFFFFLIKFVLPLLIILIFLDGLGFFASTKL